MSDPENEVTIIADRGVFKGTVEGDTLRVTRRQRWGIWCTRSLGSVFGPATAWLKGLDGVRVEFPTASAAVARAADMNTALRTPHVHYEAREIDDD